jgi:hypothetical protein
MCAGAERQRGGSGDGKTGTTDHGLALQWFWFGSRNLLAREHSPPPGHRRAHRRDFSPHCTAIPMLPLFFSLSPLGRGEKRRRAKMIKRVMAGLVPAIHEGGFGKQ